MKNKTRKVLAVASGGGHWTQLMRLQPAFENVHVTYITVRHAYQDDVPGADFHVVQDATRWNKFAMLLQILQISWLLIRIRPDCIVTTGAAPGYWALRIGKLFGVKSCWIDSIANVEAISMGGQLAAKHADLMLTQWADLVVNTGTEFHGSVIEGVGSSQRGELNGHSSTPGCS